MTDKILTLKEGNLYKCRNGSIRKVIHIRPNNYLVVIDPYSNTNMTSSRNEDGKDSLKRESEWDLVEEYIEPVVEKKYVRVERNKRDKTLVASGFKSLDKEPAEDTFHYDFIGFVEITITDGKITEAKLYENPS